MAPRLIHAYSLFAYAARLSAGAPAPPPPAPPPPPPLRAYVINLEHRPERLETFASRVQSLWEAEAEEEEEGEAPPRPDGGGGNKLLDYTVLRATDHDGARSALESGGVKVDATFLSRGTGGRKGMTLGEVGCALSHARAWRAIADELAGPDVNDPDDSIENDDPEDSTENDNANHPDKKFALVLEDDAHLSRDFARRIPSVLESAAAHGADFVYLAYKPRPGYPEYGTTNYPVDSNLQTCTYSWWTLAYAISGSAAKRLADAAESTYLPNLVPVDEYLPIVLGNLDGAGGVLGKERDARYPDLRLSCYTVRGGQLAEPADELAVSDTEVSDLASAPDLKRRHLLSSSFSDDAQSQSQSREQPQRLHQPRPDLLVFTVATDPTHFGYVTLKRSADFFGYTLVNLGEGKEWGGYLYKLELMEEALEALAKEYANEANGYFDDDLPVLFVDGYDTVFQVGPEEVVRRFEELEEAKRSEGGQRGEGALFFGAERYCWPSEAVCARYHDEQASDDVYPYLNSGTYIGRAGTLRSSLADVASARSHYDDQQYFSEKLAAYVQTGEGVPIHLDSGNVLFQPLLGVPRSDWSVSEGMYGNQFRLVKTVEGGGAPAVLHGQGPSKYTLIGLSNYLAGAYSSFYGTKRHQHRTVRAGDVYPLSVGLFFTKKASSASDDTTHADFLAGVASLHVDWSRTKLFVYYAPDLPIDREAIDDAVSRLGLGLGAEYDTIETDEALARAVFLSTAAEDGAALALMLDSDAILHRRSLVTDLAGWDRPVVAGHAQRPGKLWSNYWTDMDHYAGEGWYEDGFDVDELYRRKRRGLFQVPFARAVVLVRGSEAGRLAGLFRKNTGAGDDSVRRTCKDAIEAGVGVYMDNKYKYASLVDPEEVQLRQDTSTSCTIEDTQDVHPVLSKDPALRIPRERNLSLEDYYEKYADTQTPVIIEDYGKVFAAMSEANILRECGHRNASVARRSEKGGKWAKLEWFWNGPLKDTMSEICEQTKLSKGDAFKPVEGSIVGVFDWSLQRHCPELLENHFVVPKYLAQDFLQRVPHDEDLYYRDVWPSLFVGVNGTFGANHRDVFGSTFWMYVIDGAKEWHVVDSVDDSDFFQDASPITRHFHDVVKKGELLIVPGNSWHQVRNWGRTVALAGNFISRGSFGSMRREVEGELEKDPENAGSHYRELGDTLLSPDFDTSIDYNQSDLSWLEYRSQSDPKRASKNRVSANSDECKECSASNAMQYQHGPK